jgi:ribosomal protein S18 acetylase RimI-like enzyme
VAVEIKLKLDIVTDELYWSSDISALLVSEGFRRRRLATEMMALAEKELAPDGSEPEEYTLEVHRECSDARALYESLGYDSYGTREIDHYDRHLVTDFMRKNAAT